MKKENHEHSGTNQDIAKKLDINQELEPQQYMAEWTKNASSLDYNIVIFSVGGAKKISQQIPSFTNNLGKVAILNIDHSFNEDEMKSTSYKNNITVNYLKASIKDVELLDSIKTVIQAKEKVILLSHISPMAPYYAFKEIFEDTYFIENYNKNILFFLSYYEDQPTVIGSKKLVEATTTMTDGDFLDNMNTVFNYDKTPKPSTVLGSDVYDSLSDIESKDVLSHFTYDQ